MKLTKLITLLSCPIVITGCSFFSPEYKKPDVEDPKKWQHQSEQLQLKHSDLPDLAWWEKFNDPKLNALINDALKNNNNIQVAMGNIIQAQAQVDGVDYSWLPTAGVGGDAFIGQTFNTRFSNKSDYPSLNGLEPDSNGTFSGYDGGFVPSYTINIMRQIKMGNVTDLNLLAQHQAKNAIRLAVISQVAGNYFNFLGLKRQLKLHQQLLSDAESVKHYALIQYHSGSISQLNVDGAKQLISVLKSQIPKIKNDLTQTQNALKVLTNQNPGKVVTDNQFDNIKTTGIIPVNLPSKVLKSRPDVAIAEYKLQMANEQIAVAASQFFPSISLTGFLGDASVQLSNLFSLGATFWSTAIGAAVPILNMPALADIDQQKGAYYSAYYNYIQTVRSAFAEVDNSLTKNTTVRQTYQDQQYALSDAKREYKLTRIMYDEGAISYAETLMSKMNMDYMKSMINQTKIQQMNSIVHLYEVLGGGYNVNNHSKPKPFNDEHDV